MKTATYRQFGGGILSIEYDENAPCINCGEPVVEASMGGTAVCPWCDVGECRYCKARLWGVPEQWREHMSWHHQQEGSHDQR